MSAKKVLLALLGLILALAGSIFVWSLQGTGDSVTPKICDRIEVGMTEDQVRFLIGRPADREFHPWDIMPYLPPAQSTEWEKLWIGGSGAIIVDFDAKGLVCNKAFSGEWH